MKWSQNQLKDEINFPELINISPLKYKKPEEK